MKDILRTAGIFAVIVVLAFALMWGTRLFSNATTQLTLHTPKPGVTCAAMVTSDGAAISCWKD